MLLLLLLLLLSLPLLQELRSENLGQCSSFKAIPGSGLSCTVSGVGHLLEVNTEKHKNKKNETLSVKVGAVVIDESTDIDPLAVIGGPTEILNSE